jgi:phospho-N-acetylmuramoyl-pentapeptide-transferase
MLYYLSLLSGHLTGLNLFRYTTFRAGLAAALAFLFCLLLGRRMITALYRLKLGQQVRTGAEWEAIHHAGKAGTPTMGGVLILAACTTASLLCCHPSVPQCHLALATLLYMGGVGFLDDFLKIRCHNSDGLSERAKLILQGFWALVAILWMHAIPALAPHLDDLYVPFLKTPLFHDPTHLVEFVLVFLLMLGATNAVNFTDGLDGLAAGTFAPTLATYLVLAYLAGHSLFAAYLHLPAIAGSNELTVFCAALLGAVGGFLWWNAYPAKVFMGDTGSLALGGVIAVLPALVKHELLLLLAGFVFVAEVLSVIIQRTACKRYRRRTGQTLPPERRPFRMTPIHHHFEIISKEHLRAAGRSPDSAENSVVIRFWIVSLICAALALATLKVR